MMTIPWYQFCLNLTELLETDKTISSWEVGKKFIDLIRIFILICYIFYNSGGWYFKFIDNYNNYKYKTSSAKKFV